MAAIALATQKQRDQATKAVTKLRELTKVKGSLFRFVHVYKSYNTKTHQLRVKVYMVFGWRDLPDTVRTKIAKLGFEYNCGDLLAHF